jgi:general L-amino acid transport system permease protein
MPHTRVVEERSPAPYSAMTVRTVRSSTRNRAWLQQGIAVAVGVALLWWLGRNVVATLATNGVPLGFGFLRDPAGFAIGDALLSYTPQDSIARAILVGLANTARVSVIGWVLAIALGFMLGLMRLSDNPPLRAVARGCVEALRNTPLLLLLLVIAAAIHTLPGPRAAFEPLPGFFLSDRGLVLPAPVFGWPPAWDIPRLTGFNFTGGITVSPELAALVAALVLHHAAHISEVVRGAVRAVPRGQRDAAYALGLSRAQTTRHVVMPQALRAMVPLLASNCVSLTKNSSLAVAIGFADVVSILNTTANQTGHAVETMLLMIVIYLALSLTVASAMNGYNARLLRAGGRR